LAAADRERSHVKTAGAIQAPLMVVHPITKNSPLTIVKISEEAESPARANGLVVAPLVQLIEH